MLRKYNYPKTCSWWDYSEPTPKELAAISKEIKVNIANIRLLLDKDSRPKSEDADKFSLIVFRAPVIREKLIVTAPIAIFFNKTKVITIRDKKIDGIEAILKLKEIQRSNILKKGASYTVYRLLDSLLDSFFMELENIEEDLEKTEKIILAKAGKKSMKRLFDVKKSLIFFHKALIANREVITSIEKEYVSHISPDDLKYFRKLYDDCIQLIDLEETYREILIGLLDVHLTVISNNMNKIMKTLTVIAAFIWVPTLIAGIYGMNFFASGSEYAMPEISWIYGYPFALGLMVLSVVIIALFFKKKGWLKTVF